MKLRTVIRDRILEAFEYFEEDPGFLYIRYLELAIVRKLVGVNDVDSILAMLVKKNVLDGLVSPEYKKNHPDATIENAPLSSIICDYAIDLEFTRLSEEDLGQIWASVLVEKNSVNSVVIMGKVSDVFEDVVLSLEESTTRPESEIMEYSKDTMRPDFLEACRDLVQRCNPSWFDSVFGGVSSTDGSRWIRLVVVDPFVSIGPVFGILSEDEPSINLISYLLEDVPLKWRGYNLQILSSVQSFYLPEPLVFSTKGPAFVDGDDSFQDTLSMSNLLSIVAIQERAKSFRGTDREDDVIISKFEGDRIVPFSEEEAFYPGAPMGLQLALHSAIARELVGFDVEDEDVYVRFMLWSFDRQQFHIYQESMKMPSDGVLQTNMTAPAHGGSFLLIILGTSEEVLFSSEKPDLSDLVSSLDKVIWGRVLEYKVIRAGQDG